MSSDTLHASLLRPAILHILRASGFHATRPSVLDTLADITIRYMLILATRTKEHAFSNHNTPIPDITDVRMALQDCGLLAPSLTAAEEAWKEALRKPLSEYPERNGLRQKEKMKRDKDDTEDVKEFLDWVRGDQNHEIKRIAGLVREEIEGQVMEVEAAAPEDYLTALKKKHSKTGEESRYQGTVLGIPADLRRIKIEGGPVESIEEWITQTQKRVAQLNASQKNGDDHVKASIEDRMDTRS